MSETLQSQKPYKNITIRFAVMLKVYKFIYFSADNAFSQ